MKIGNNDIDKLYVGGTEVDAVYLGTEKVYGKETYDFAIRYYKRDGTLYLEETDGGVLDKLTPSSIIDTSGKTIYFDRMEIGSYVSGITYFEYCNADIDKIVFTSPVTIDSFNILDCSADIIPKFIFLEGVGDPTGNFTDIYNELTGVEIYCPEQSAEEYAAVFTPENGFIIRGLSDL